MTSKARRLPGGQPINTGTIRLPWVGKRPPAGGWPHGLEGAERTLLLTHTLGHQPLTGSVGGHMAISAATLSRACCFFPVLGLESQPSASAQQAPPWLPLPALLLFSINILSAFRISCGLFGSGSLHLFALTPSRSNHTYLLLCSLGFMVFVV